MRLFRDDMGQQRSGIGAGLGKEHEEEMEKEMEVL